ncbi:ATP-binding protein [Spirillospora sp. CA-294931]|uniref:ATP-binding protein n=1 Tax=Spirillospora sp. CA-294931 TaxID=3240042 RepID=UPI003D8E6222
MPVGGVRAALARLVRVVAAGREVRNQASGTVGGDVIQVGAVHGDVHVAAAEVTAAAAVRTLPADVASFTGRSDQLDRLVREASRLAAGGGVVTISAIDGMAGVGKTAFAVHAAHRLADAFPDGQIFLRLHGHTPGQRPVSSADALGELLLATGVPPGRVPAGVEARSRLWRDRAAGGRRLLLLDDATGSDQVRPLLPGTDGTMVLVTSRRRLAGLQDAARVTLDVLSPGEAARLFVRLSGRPGLRPADAAVVETVALCGHLPLAVRLMAGQLKHRPAWTPADLIADLRSSRGRLEALRAEDDSVTAAFDLSYRDLTAGQRRFFRRLGLQPGPDIDAYAAAALGDVDPGSARGLLDDLYSWHLIDEPVRGRYRFHDLIREHARALAAADDPADRERATDRLLDYFLHASRVADRHLARRVVTPVDALSGEPPIVPDLPTREAAAAWMDAERLNLLAAADHAAATGRHRHANALPAAMHGFMRTQGHWNRLLELHRAAAGAAGLAGDALGEANALSDLGVMLRLSGDTAAAEESLTRSLELYSRLGDRQGQGNARNFLACVRRSTGHYAAARSEFAQALELYREIGDRPGEANVLNNLGLIQHLSGDHREASASQRAALALHREVGDRLGEANAHLDLGAVLQVTGDLREASARQRAALAIYRELGDQPGEANALNHLGATLRLADDHETAQACQREALALHRRIGNQLGEAETLNNLGELALACSRPDDGLTLHDRALAIARAIASPIEEARALEGTARCRPPELAEPLLREALAIYRRIGSAHAHRLETSLRDPGD